MTTVPTIEIFHFQNGVCNVFSFTIEYLLNGILTLFRIVH